MSDSSDEAGEEIVLQENSERFESEGEHVDAIRQETRGHKAVDLKNMKRRRVLSPSDKYTTSVTSPKADKRKGAVNHDQKSAKRPQRMADAPPQRMAKNQRNPLKMGIKSAPLMMGILRTTPRTSTLDPDMIVSRILVTLIVTVINIAVLTLTRRRNRG